MGAVTNPGITIETAESGVIVRWKQQNISFKHSFLEGEFPRRAAQPNQGILKACSNRKKTLHRILDLTGGWGLDSFILANHGKSVTLVEKNKTVFDVIASSLNLLGKQKPDSQAFRNLKIVLDNALDYLQQQAVGVYDCIYLDPMFPAHKSTAKPSKTLQLLQQLTSNQDIESVFELALQHASQRVVVKRPLKALPLEGIEPHQVVREKTIRFDIYQVDQIQG